MLLELIAAGSAVVGGFYLGRIYGAVGGYEVEAGEPVVVPSTTSTASAVTEVEKVTEVADRIKEQAETITASVDEHQTRMQAFNDTLIDTDNNSAEDVLAVVNELMEANRTMQRDLNEAQSRIREQSMELESAERRAHTDALTRIPNRGAFDEFIAAQHALGTAQTTTLALLDVDHFKQFNDNHGHLAGDEVLRVVAGLLHSRLNSFGMVARYGGEEFAIVFAGTGADDVRQAIEQARVAISMRETEFEHKALRVTASLGLAQFDGQESIDDWIARADKGLYESKEAGRNCSHWMNGDEAELIQIDDHTDRATTETDNENVSPKDDSSDTPQEIVDMPSDDAGSVDVERDDAEATDAERTDENQNDVEEIDNEEIEEDVVEGPESDAEETGTTDDADDEIGIQNDLDGEDIPDCFADMPNQAALGEEFDGLRDRMQSDMPVYLMAIRHHHATSDAAMNSLLPVVRSTLRTVDRIGYADASTLLICMLSVEEGTARERGTQICKSALAMDMATRNEGGKPVTVGITRAEPDADFDTIVSRATKLSMSGLDEENEAVCMESDAVTAS